MAGNDQIYPTIHYRELYGRPYEPSIKRSVLSPRSMTHSSEASRWTTRPAISSSDSSRPPAPRGTSGRSRIWSAGISPAARKRSPPTPTATSSVPPTRQPHRASCWRAKARRQRPCYPDRCQRAPDDPRRHRHGAGQHPEPLHALGGGEGIARRPQAPHPVQGPAGGRDHPCHGHPRPSESLPSAHADQGRLCFPVDGSVALAGWGLSRSRRRVGAGNRASRR